MAYCNWCAKYAGYFVGPLRIQFDGVTDFYQPEQLLDVGITQPDAAMRRRAANRSWIAGAVYPVAFAAQSDPTRAERVLLARRHYSSRAVPSWMRDSDGNREATRGAGSCRGADCDRVNFDHVCIFQQRQLPIWNADDDPSRGGPRLLGQCFARR